MVAVIVIPVLLVVIVEVLKLVQPEFIRQWEHTGKVNSHVEEMFSGHLVVRAYGQRNIMLSRLLKNITRVLYKSSFIANSFSSLR